MVPRMLVAALAALALAGAGCMGSSAPAQPADAPGLGLPSSPLPFPDPGESAVCETKSQVELDENATYSGNAHSHDAWGGEPQILAFEGDVSPQHGWTDFEGFVVEAGTGKIEFTLKWEDAAAATATKRLLQADMPGDERDYEELYQLPFNASGDTRSLPVGPSNADRPHSEYTAWSFKLDGAAWARIVLHRGDYCIPIDPPHLDLWEGETSRVLLRANQTRTFTTACASESCVLSAVDYYGVTPGAGDLVPPGTGTMTVTLKWRPDVPVPIKFRVEYIGAESEVTSYFAIWKLARLSSEAENERVYEFAVAPESCDNPYESETSAWHFRALVDNGDLHEHIGETAAWQGTLEWRVDIHHA